MLLVRDYNIVSASTGQKSIIVAGISLKTLQAYALIFAARLSSILVRPAVRWATGIIMMLCCLQIYEGYLPFDRSGDWFYQACEIIALLQVLSLIVLVGFV